MDLRTQLEAEAAQAFDTIDTGRCKNPDCRSTNLVSDWEAGDIVCGECGWVRFDRVEDPGKDWRVSTDDGAVVSERASATTAIAELLEQKDEVRVDFQRDAKMRLHSGRNVSLHDDVVLKTQEIVERLARRLPGEVYEKVKLNAIEVFVKFWEATERKAKRTSQMIAACMWLVCYLRQLPFIEPDFVKALSPDLKDPQKEFKRAKKLLQRFFSENETLNKLGKELSADQGASLGSQYAEVSRRWVAALGLPYALGVFAVAIAEKLQTLPVSAVRKKDVIHAAAIHIACHRPGAPAREESVTATRIQAACGIAALDGYLQQLLPQKKKVLRDAVATLDPAILNTLAIDVEKWD